MTEFIIGMQTLISGGLNTLLYWFIIVMFFKPLFKSVVQKLIKISTTKTVWFNKDTTKGEKNNCFALCY